MLFARACALIAALTCSACAAAAPDSGDLPHRIVSLSPALTEDLFAIGAGGRVVGVSTGVEVPHAARALPVVATFDTADAESIVKLQPDVVVGISEEAAASDVRHAGIRTVLVRSRDLDDVFGNVEALGILTGQVDEARGLTDKLRARTTALMRTVRRRDRRPRVFVVLGVGPIAAPTDDAYVAKLIALAGGTNVAAASNGTMDERNLLATQPDIVLADPSVGLTSLLDRPPWNGLRAVRTHRVAVLPDPMILLSPGPRYNDGLAWLIRTLNAMGT